MTSQRGIEANPEKIKAIMDMKAPRNINEVQKLNGRITALGRFMSCSAKRCLPFFKAFKGTQKFEWNKDCEKAFEELKEFLVTPPLLSRPLKGETFHNVVVRTNQPLRKAIQRLETSGRLVHWSIQLSEHDIRYEPRPTLKAQALADFVAKITLGENRAGAGAILRGPGKVKIEYGVNIHFTASNNVAEYEALIAGLGLALEIKTEILKIYNNLNQVKGEYQAKETGMIEYLEKVMTQLQQLETQGGQWEIIQIPREKNTEVDAIAKSASELGDLFTKMQLKETLESPSTREIEVMAIEEADSWMTPLIKYLDHGELPTDKTEAIRIIRKSANYSYHIGVLYRTSLTHPWSRCVLPQT
ncbi:uncharacterized protein LOC126687665 [Mercurialis annua]|uniref:uncharacterized protein LOC126687665 n=1 Tax=Mercurialis annua TaxID=3986 RepID=UPI00216029B6|nr:uncharacterized protein LOC126687665 [Mercurialis annua]